MYRLPTLAKNASRAIITKPHPIAQRLFRLYSSKTPSDPQNGETQEDIDVPWYLRDDISSPLLEKEEVKLPPIPEYAPAEVSKFCDLMANKYGMADILLFDMTELDESHDYRANNKNTDYIIICSGKSERHNLKAAGEFRYYLKHEYDYVPHMEGMNNGALTPVMRRRLLRRASRGPPATSNDYGMSANSWILCQHENIDVHIMTKERRDELNLESMWCKPEDAHKYQSVDSTPDMSDHIFSGIRRFHTSARSLSSANFLESQLEKLHSISLDASDAEITKHIEEFESGFVNPTAFDHTARFDFYRTLHLIRPKLVTFEQAEKALLDKYGALNLALDPTVDLNVEKPKDVTRYVKLLIDSPEWNREPFEKVHADQKFQKLSSFIRVLYCFSGDTFSMTSDPEFIPLVWRLSCHEVSAPVSSKMVDDVINGGQLKANEPGNSLEMAAYDANAVLELVAHENKETGKELSPALQELILFTYANAGKWDRFWNLWDEICFLRSATDKPILESWLRLTVFLSLINNKAQILHYFNHHWDIGGGVGGTVLSALRENGGAFDSDAETHAFKSAVRSMISSHGADKFEGAQKFIAQL